MKKVGIVTFHRALNYGAVLQSYALQRVISSSGAECEIVDYICPKIKKDYAPFRIYRNDFIKSFAKSLIMYRRRAKRRDSFKPFFDNYLVKSKKQYTSENIDTLKNDYDLFVSGSDQVWSPGCAGFDPVYFLTFADDNQKYSYAASFARTTLPQEKINEYQKRLSGFRKFSVREESGERLVKELTGRDAVTHLDPTLLISSEEWGKIAISKIDKPYILIFTANPQVSLLDFALKLSKEKKLPVYYINDAPHINRNGIKYIVAPSVEEFVGYFKGAEYVITNSFHGTALSVIFNRNLFVEFKNKSGRNIRSEELLKMLGIEREITDGNCEETKIDWSDVNLKIKEYTNESLIYLSSFTQE